MDRSPRQLTTEVGDTRKELLATCRAVVHVKASGRFLPPFPRRGSTFYSRLDRCQGQLVRRLTRSHPSIVTCRSGLRRTRIWARLSFSLLLVPGVLRISDGTRCSRSVSFYGFAGRWRLCREREPGRHADDEGMVYCEHQNID